MAICLCQNDYSCHLSGVLSVTFDHYHWLLRLASVFIETCTITSNARYRQLVNTIMLMNTLAILRGTFGNFRPLSLTTSTCVNLHRDLYHYLERALSLTCEWTSSQSLGVRSVTSDHYHWLLRLASIFILRTRAIANLWHYNVNEHPSNPSGYFP